MIFNLAAVLVFVRSMVETYNKCKRKKKYYLKRITSFSLTSIKLRFGEAVGILTSVLLLMGVCFGEAFYTIQNYCNAVCIAIILIDASVFIAEGMLMVGAIKCLRGGKNNMQAANKGRNKGADVDLNPDDAV